MKRMIGLVMMVGVWIGCGEDTPTGPTKGPQGQTLEVYNGEDEDGNRIEYQFYRNGDELIKHGYYKEYDGDGTLRVDGTFEQGKWSTGPQGQTLEVYNGENDWGSRIEYQFYRDKNGNHVYHGFYKLYWDPAISEGGKVMYERNWVDGKREGKWVEYDNDGNKIGEWCYQQIEGWGENGKSVDLSLCE
jgi:antitoxin component YwqK of YwqJK toxin-antitoxin module